MLLIAEGHPTADLGKRTTATHAQAGFRIDGADMDAGCLHAIYIEISQSHGKSAEGGDFRNLLGSTKRVAGVPGEFAADNAREGHGG